jgi:hypothetical protein
MRAIWLAVPLALAAAAARGQTPLAPGATPGAVLENAKLRVELVGLRRWTVPMIRDSLRMHAPQDSLLSHACAAVLRDKLRFADASVVFYPAEAWGTAKDYMMVTVVEPQDSARVRYRPTPPDSAPDLAAWAPARRVEAADRYAYNSLLQRPDLLLGRRAPEPRDSAVRAALPLRAFLRAHRRPADRDRALRVLARDGNYRNRHAAVLVLANFVGEDRAWWALADALRDPDGRVSGAAGMLLAGLARTMPRRVDWEPATDTLRAVLDGTNLFAHSALLDVLAATGVAPALAPALLRGGGDIVLAKLGAGWPDEQARARRFLAQVAGRDMGAAPAAWRTWVASL